MADNSDKLLPVPARLRVGVIGAGRMGTLHARSVTDIGPGSELVVYDRDHAAAVRLATMTGGTAVRSLDELFPLVDAVIVTSPADARHETLACAMAARLPIFCEKPLAATAAEADRIAALARLHGARLQVGFQRRHDADYQWLYEQIRTGRLGDILLIRATAFDHQPPSSDYKKAAGDIFADCLIHDIDAVRWLSGQEVTAVQADGAQLLSTPNGASPAFDVATLVLTLSGGSRAVLTASRRNPRGYDHRIEVLGTADSVSVGLEQRSPLRLRVPAGAGSVTHDAGWVWRDFTDRFAEAYRQEMQTFLAMVAGDTPALCTADEAAAAQRVATAAAESARTETRIEISAELAMSTASHTTLREDGR